MTDRFEEIKALFSRGEAIWRKDARWLIAEVERLRTALRPSPELAERYYAVRRYKFQRDWCDLTATEKSLWVEVVEQVLAVAAAVSTEPRGDTA